MTKTDSPARNPMVWLMVGLPLAAVVAGFVTLYLAVNAGGNDAVADEVRRTAQIQVSELGPDERATQLRLSAVLRIDEATVDLLPATGTFERTSELVLSLRHPTRAAEDVSLVLQPTASGWTAAHALQTTHDWNVQATAKDGQWRLHARLPAQSRSVLLRPALADPAPSGATTATGRTDPNGMP